MLTKPKPLGCRVSRSRMMRVEITGPKASNWRCSGEGGVEGEARGVQARSRFCAQEMRSLQRDLPAHGGLPQHHFHIRLGGIP